MNKILRILKELTITKVLEWLILVLGGTLLTALPILFHKQIVPLLSQTHWSILCTLLLAFLFLSLWVTLKCRHQIYSKKRPIKILLKKFEKQHALFLQIDNDQEQLRHWGNATEPLFDHPRLLEFKKEFIENKSWLFIPKTSISYRKDASKRILDIMDKAIEILKHEIDTS